ncbi:MAG: EamA family transporter [Blautia sp.]
MYVVPVITVVTSVLVLHETITWMSGAGTVLALLGLFLSEYRGKMKG